MTLQAVLLDTNVFVAAGFKPKSHSAQIVAQVRDGLLPMVWNEQTRQETAFIVRKIPPLSWDAIAPLFRLEDCYLGDLFPERFALISDPADIKFAALADATGAVLITMDRDLLSIRDAVAIAIWTPSEFAISRDRNGDHRKQTYPELHLP
ncbi:putative toxin-antitoxin system toxin component, PIN family [Altericista sp. CCNU0014]|uniref:PIN domain-containing protein n=1 Tax=Altericista sp. CCNU0014 TaxID=3082949 RepID=UPI00384B5A68